MGMEWRNQILAESTGRLTSPGLSFPAEQRGRAIHSALTIVHSPTRASVSPAVHRGWGSGLGATSTPFWCPFAAQAGRAPPPRPLW